MRRAGLALIAAAALMGQAAPPPAVDVALWRLDCGRIETSGFAAFSDTGRYDGKSYKLVDSCYLIKHGADYMLWDTGLSRDMLGKTVSDEKDKATLTTTIVDQLRSIGVSPTAVRYVGISHYHDDHTGQAGDFPSATLLIGAEDGPLSTARKVASVPQKRSARGAQSGRRSIPLRVTATCSATGR